MEDFLLAGDLAAEEVVAVDSNTQTMVKTECFKREINYIKNDRIRESAEVLVNSIPDYFFHEAASSTGKYHPSFSLGEGGLLRHTKVAVRIAHELLLNNTTGKTFTNDEKDLIILALIMHDSIKRGDGKIMYAVDHPILAANNIKENKDKMKLTDEELSLVCSMIETHMGEWNKDFKGNVILDVPTSKYQRFVHMCDFLSAKKFLDVKFDDKNDIVF